MFPIVLRSLVNASTSSALWKLPVIETVALARVVLSVSPTVRAASITTGVEAALAASVNGVVPTLVPRLGAALGGLTEYVCPEVYPPETPFPAPS